jgi:hypothetical protein
MVERCVVSA